MSRSLLVSGEDEKEDPLGFRSLETEKRRRAILGISVERGTSGMAY